IGARGERGVMDGALQAIQSGDLKARSLFAGGTGFAELLHIPGMAKSFRAAVLKHNNSFVEIAKMPVEQQSAHIKELEATQKDLAHMMCAAVTRVAVAFQRDRASLRCAAVMLALERYRRAENRWPESLTDLVPAYL